MCFQFSPFDIFENYDISSLKQVLIGGNPLPYDIYEDFAHALPDVFVIQVYCVYICYKYNLQSMIVTQNRILMALILFKVCLKQV